LGQIFISWQQKKIEKNWEFFFKGKLDPKMFNFFEKNTKLSNLQNWKKKKKNKQIVVMQLGKVFFLNFEVQQYWGTSLETFQLNGWHFFITPLNGNIYIYLWQHTSPKKLNYI
jgi:hypothetical protein